MMWSCSKRLAYMVANIRKREREEKAKARSNNYDQEVILEQPTSNITPTPCSLPGPAEKRPSRLHMWLVYFNLSLVSGYLQQDINKFPSAHNRTHDFRKFKSLQGSPNLAHHKVSRSMKDIPSPKTIRSDLESRL